MDITKQNKFIFFGLTALTAIYLIVELGFNFQLIRLDEIDDIASIERTADFLVFVGFFLFSLRLIPLPFINRLITATVIAVIALFMQDRVINYLLDSLDNKQRESRWQR